MKNVKKNSGQGYTKTISPGLAKKFGALVLGAAFLVVGGPIGPTVAKAGDSAITQLEYLQWLARLCGDSYQFSASSTAADYVQWARTKGLNPTGGWLTGAALTRDALAQTLVQLFNISPNKQGINYEQRLRSAGINLPDENEISRKGLVSLVDEIPLRSRLADIAASSGSPVSPGNGKGLGLGLGNNPNGIPTLPPTAKAKPNPANPVRKGNPHVGP